VPRIPHTTPGLWPDPIPESRFASRIRRDSPEGCRVAILGLADDLGVRLNNGRPGAKDGPRAFRAALARYGVADPYGWEWPAVYDAGDIIPAEGDDEAALHETHRRVTEATAALLELGLFPIGIGGGHDLTFPFVRAVAQRLAPKRLGGVYFDAHLDVRETVGSGMPFRRLVEECGVGPLDIVGCAPHVNSREHVEWFRAHGGRYQRNETQNWWSRTVSNVPWPEWPEGDASFFCSFDLDCLDSSIAPGVSAPNASGLLQRDVEARVHKLAKHTGCACFDIMELNPNFDQDWRTARVAAYLFLTFLTGRVRRTD
jgi:formiminoglutamase